MPGPVARPGYGYGGGFGSGHCVGDGSGNGSADGFGDGFGFGFGFGCGGSGNGFGHGFGFGCGGYRDGYGHGYGVAIGDLGGHAVTVHWHGRVVRVGCQVHTVDWWRQSWRAVAMGEDVTVTQAEVDELLAKVEAFRDDN